MNISRNRLVLQKFTFQKCQLRSVSSSPHDDNHPKWIAKFNESISANIYVTFPFFLGIRNVTWYGLVFLISQTMPVGPELGIAYMITKFTGKFRQPINVGLAAGISEAIPSFRHVKASALFGSFSSADSVKTDPSSSIEKLANWISGPVDKYGRKRFHKSRISLTVILSGFSFYIASKVSLFSSVAGIATLIRCGIDVSSVLTTLGINDTLQETAGAMGASTLINVLLLPVHLGIMTYALPVINNVYETRKMQ